MHFQSVENVKVDQELVVIDASDKFSVWKAKDVEFEVTQPLDCCGVRHLRGSHALWPLKSHLNSRGFDHGPTDELSSVVMGERL